MNIQIKLNELQSEIAKTINAAYEEGKSVGRAEALEDFEKCAIQQSSYTETEEGWSGMTIDTKTIKSIKEQLKERKNG